MMRGSGIIDRWPSAGLCGGAVLWCLLALTGSVAASPLSEKAKESKCVDKPVAKGGELYTCMTDSGVVSYFNVPGADDSPPAERGSKRSASAPTPAGFPRVTGETQKVRDDMRRKVLADELASEQKLLVEARAAFADGAPAPLPDERTDAEKYRVRLAKLRQTVTVHERNIEALKKEIALVK
jgi:hypothetical protein